MKKVEGTERQMQRSDGRDPPQNSCGNERDLPQKTSEITKVAFVKSWWNLPESSWRNIGGIAWNVGASAPWRARDNAKLGEPWQSLLAAQDGSAPAEPWTDLTWRTLVECVWILGGALVEPWRSIGGTSWGTFRRPKTDLPQKTIETPRDLENLGGTLVEC